MWHVETDYFALAIFLIMLIKERPSHRFDHDVQGRTFYCVLIVSIVNVIVDIASSLAMNRMTLWWPYELLMTVYVATMPLLAVMWVCYTYVLAHKTEPIGKIKRSILFILAPYVLYVLVAFSNPATGLFFQLSPDMQYERGILFMPLGVGAIMAYSFLGLAQVLIDRKRIAPKSSVYLLAAFYVVTACFTWVQLANPGWLIINASYAFIYVWCDITVEEQRRGRLLDEIARKNEELQAALERAESASQAKSEFLSRMSHDIRTPLNAMIGLTHLAQNEDDSKTVHQYLDKSAESSTFLLGLLNDILDMSKIEDGELTLSPEPMGKESFVSALDTVVRPMMDQKGIRFTCSLDGLPSYVMVDGLRFEQIFFNLLSNAAKFTPEGGSVSFTATAIEQNGKSAKVRFVVRDSGIGMSEEYLEHLYDPFVREQSGLNNNTEGTGLGLPITKSLVDAMGGTMRVESKPGQGTECTVELALPLAQEVQESRTERQSESVLQGMEVLVVEDNALNTEVAKLILEKAGCEVTTACDGQDALNKFSAAKPGWFGAVLMDVRMPVMDGLEATRAIRALDRPDAASVPIVAVTADAFPEQRKRTIEAGMNFHLSKPIEPEVLYETLAKCVMEAPRSVA